MAAESVGANRRRILRRHVTPQLNGLIITEATLNIIDWTEEANTWLTAAAPRAALNACSGLRA